MVQIPDTLREYLRVEGPPVLPHGSMVEPRVFVVPGSGLLRGEGRVVVPAVVGWRRLVRVSGASVSVKLMRHALSTLLHRNKHII